MLHAVNGRKARLAAFRGAGLRVPLEDVVTSSVFGPLEFMSEEDRAEALNRLFETLDLAIKPWRGPVRLQFWPKLATRDTAMRSRYVEPDLIVADERGPRVLVEIKWGAGLSERELAAQWSSVPDPPRRNVRHLLIVKQTGDYLDSIAHDSKLLADIDCAPWHFAMRSWRQVGHAAEALAHAVRSSGVAAWARAVADLIRREEGHVMHGWDQLTLLPVEPIAWRFRGDWFGSLKTTGAVKGWWHDGG